MVMPPLLTGLYAWQSRVQAAARLREQIAVRALIYVQKAMFFMG
jgi:hypothetical protein